ncbi:cell wall-associated NlpC family hydrolase [Pseudonocardia sediminis]|uniref:Cell wall-associated NlpC family hydrolase n=1 Tax=Pseudonocardia sediminis TaxID=1397368 RepID=A0A4Q7V8M7_PSEST|nr:NlpC/P60 family protein [Pseudonocardia sediminis]RZT89213.1 cell wall-associated NlpC family hydrolase [Pseudonocardia sediminis]
MSQRPIATTPSTTHDSPRPLRPSGPLRVLATTLAATAALAVLPLTAATAAPAPAGPDTAPVSRAVEPAAQAAPAALPAAAKAAATRSSAVQNAMSKVGSPYRWGATGPNAFDCSGLVNWAFEQEGVDLPRTSRALASAGSPVSKSALRPGDIVTFYKPVSHVGIYIGDGQIVHASTSGTPVKVSDMDRMPFNSARRI